jgi:MoxR-like ATPase
LEGHNTVPVTEDREIAYEGLHRIEEQLKRVIVGQERLLRLLMMGLFAKIPYSFKAGAAGKAGSGHVLLEGVPGLAKTLAATALARSIHARFQRIQFTPDLLPADILGTRVFDAATNLFRTEKGPIFANLVLADEINRATPKTQSALLEAMQERQVTIGEQTYPLESPFWVLATQNPLEEEGVYVLPEAQIDRFAMKIVVEYPPRELEAQILATPITEISIEPIMEPADILHIQDVISHIQVSPLIHQYIIALCQATRGQDGSPPGIRDWVLVGASPRSSQHVLALSRVAAFWEHRHVVLPEDVKAIAVESLQHRIVRTVHAEAEGVTGTDIVRTVLKHVPIP